MVDDQERSEGIARISRWAWGVSALISLGCLIAIGTMWVRASLTLRRQRRPPPIPRYTQDEVTRYLEALMPDPEPGSGNPPVYIPTGLYIKSLQFKGPYGVQVSGYVPQRYAHDLPKDLVPKGEDVGFVMPKAQYARFFKVYQAQQGNEELIGWSFFATLREQFDYEEFRWTASRFGSSCGIVTSNEKFTLRPTWRDTIRSTLPRYPRWIRISFWKTGTFRKATLVIAPPVTIRVLASRAMSRIKGHPNCATTSPSDGTF